MRWKLTMSSSLSVLQRAQPAQLVQPHRGQALRLDIAHVPAAALDAQHVDIFAELIFRGGLHRCVAAAVQHQLRIAAEQPRRIGAQREIFAHALRGVALRQNPWLRRRTSGISCLITPMSSPAERSEGKGTQVPPKLREAWFNISFLRKRALSHLVPFPRRAIRLAGDDRLFR